MAGSCEAYAEDRRIPEDILYGELRASTRPAGRPSLWYMDVCKRDLKNAQINTECWKGRAADKDVWRLLIKVCVKVSDRDKRDRMKRKRQEKNSRPAELPNSEYVCTACRKDCHSSIGLVAHLKHCVKQWRWCQKCADHHLTRWTIAYY